MALPEPECGLVISYSYLWRIAAAIGRQVNVLKRIPEKMDPKLYYKTFRPYIRFFENVVYEGVNQQAIDLLNPLRHSDDRAMGSFAL